LPLRLVVHQEANPIPGGDTTTKPATATRKPISPQVAEATRSFNNPYMDKATTNNPCGHAVGITPGGQGNRNL
jgi:hypothetical protein